MDRFEIFKELKRLVEFADPYYENSIFNPFQVMISELFIKTVSYLKNERSQFETVKKNNFGELKLTLKYVKDKVIYSTLSEYGSKHYPVLFLPTEPTHISQLTSVFNTLKNKSVDFLVVTNRLPLYKKIKKEFSSIFLPKVLLNPHRKEIETLKIQCKKVLHNFKQNLNYTLPLEYIYSILDTEIEDYVNLYFQFDTLLQKYQPKSVFVGNDTTKEGRVMTFLVKKRNNLKSFCIMHGSVTGEPLDTFHQVDCFFLYGKAAMDDLVKNGMPSERLKISGAPYLEDFLFNKTGEIDIVLKKKLGLTSTRPYILITNSGPGHSTSHEHYAKILDVIFEVASRFDDIQWVIKLHRKDNLNNFQDVLKKYPKHVIKIISSYDKDYPESIFTWLQGATCILTGASTVAIEAMALDIPVVTLDLMNEFKKVDFIEQHATIHVTNSSELQTAVHNLILHKDTYDSILQQAKNYSKNYFFKGEIKSSELIAIELLKDFK